MNLKYGRLVKLFSLLAILLLQSCSDDDPKVKIPGEEGFFIVNEGGFGNSNTSISFYDKKTDKVINNVFFAVNGRKLGDQAQSMALFNGKGYIIVQGSATVEVIDANNYTTVATISDDIESPRYFQGISSSKGYVSDWGADGLTGTIKVIDLNENTVIKTIPTGKGANRMLKIGKLVYVTNSGGWGDDNTIKIVDTTTDEVTGTLTVGDNPNSIVEDANGNLWVTSSGTVAYNEDWSIDEENSTPGTLSKINPGTNTNSETLRLEVDVITYNGIGGLIISNDGKTLYYKFNQKLYKMSTSATALPETAFKNKSYYGISIDPSTGNIIGCTAPNFSSEGSIDVIDDEDGSVINTYTVGIAPNGCAFK